MERQITVSVSWEKPEKSISEKKIEVITSMLPYEKMNFLWMVSIHKYIMTPNIESTERNDSNIEKWQPNRNYPSADDP